MSSFKTSTYVHIVDDFGEEMSEFWVAETESISNSFWKDILVTMGAVQYVWNPTSWDDFSPSSYSSLAMVADGDLDVEMKSDVTEESTGGSGTIISTDTTISVDTEYDNIVTILSGVTLDIDSGITVTISETSQTTYGYNSFRLSKNTPFVLYSNVVYGDHSSSTDAAFGGTLGTINAIRVAEPSSASVNLTMIMGN